MVTREISEQPRPGGVGCNLSLQIPEISLRIPGRVGPAGEHAEDALPIEAPFAHEAQRGQHDALLLEGGGQRRHGAGRDAADVRVVAAARGVKHELAALHRAPGSRR